MAVIITDPDDLDIAVEYNTKTRTIMIDTDNSYTEILTPRQKEYLKEIKKYVLNIVPEAVNHEYLYDQHLEIKIPIHEIFIIISRGRYTRNQREWLNKLGELYTKRIQVPLIFPKDIVPFIPFKTLNLTSRIIKSKKINPDWTWEVDFSEFE